MKKTTAILLLLLASCSLPLTAQSFILPMGYQEPWTSKLLFNHEGGFNTGGTHAWEQLYEAQAGDVYTITMPTACCHAEYGRVQFKTPVTLHADHTYRFFISLTADKDISGVNIALCENEDESICLTTTTGNLQANKKITLSRTKLTGTHIEDAKIALDFPTTEDNTVITISNISIYDTTEERELWTGTSFYNWCYYANESGQRIRDMQIEGRTETLSWTLPDFDDSQWSEAVMPIGDWGAIDGVQTEWPGGDNTNFWFRRNFILEEVDSTSRYMLHVLHDDSYRIWVNGQLLDEAEDWTNGTNAVKLEVPAALLTAGRNVIAAYVQQNWGGKLYDCGLTIEPDFYEDYAPDGNPRKLVINEIQVGNIDQYIDHSYNYGGWIEIYNPTEKNILLDGLYVSDDKTDPFKFQLPIGTGVVKAGDFKVLYFDHNSADGTYGDTAFRQIRFKLKNSGGTICLFDEAGKSLISADYPELITRCSWARRQDGSEEWGWTGEPSPAASNNDSDFADFRLDAPEVDTDSRLFTEPFSISVSIPTGATLRYTTDGSTPTAANGKTSTDGSFNISETTVLRFCLLQQGMLPSPVVTRSYIYRNHDYYLPAISIVTNRANLYDSMIGVYVDGMNGVSGRNHGASNINMDWERPVNFEYITPDGEMAVNQEAEFSISGGWSRHYAPSSFKIKATNRYEGKKSIDPYPFFPNSPYNKYRQILIRNGGNDNNSQAHGRVRDAITQQVLRSSGFYVDCQDYQPVHVFFNGRYLAQLNLREPNNRYHGYAYYGYDDDEMDAFEYSNGYFQMAGTKDAFNRWKQLASGSSSSGTYEELKELIDIDEVTNYFAAISYIGCSDWICNNNNVKGYRPLPDGRFHLTLFDQDWGWSNSNGVQLLDNNYGNELLAIYNDMKRGSSDFRRRFVDAYCILHGSVFTKDRCLAIGDSICRLVEPALSWEGKAPWTSYNEQKSQMSGQTSRTTRMNALRSAYGLSQGMTVQFSATAPGAAFLLNGQPVPGATFDGMLFAPVTLEVSAPAGYNFVGWRQNSNAVVKAVNKGDAWSYWDRGSLDGTDWKTGSVASWGEGISPLGYGKSDIATTISYGTDSNRKYPTYYFRKSFTLDGEPSDIASMTLNFTADDGFVVYINGTEACRYLMPDGEPTFDTYATTYAPGNPDSGILDLPASLLRKGENIIAVEVHNNVPGSSDIYWNAEISYSVASGTAIVSRDRTLHLDKDANTQLTAIFTPLHPDCLTAAGAPPVVVNEVSAGNSVATNEYGKRNDWIELYNTTDHDIDLSGMYLTDDPAVPQKYCITPRLLSGGTSAGASGRDDAPVIIPAHGYYIIWADKLDPLRYLHTGFNLSNADEQSVTLTAADGSWSDCLTYHAHGGDESVGRYPDGGKRIYRMTRPTIRQANTLTSYSEWLSGIDENFDEDAFLDAITSPSEEMAAGGGDAVYTIDGMKVSRPQRGINIVRSTKPDGTVSVKRIVVK
ncbi:MAG: lamin tail domain-containing protein [Prevotellaceae bacterium]|nr:lamin tail domain-containing protein [Prevotellaceae bacterium]